MATAEYLFARGARLLRLRDISAAEVESARVLQFESTGRSVQHELMLGVHGDFGANWSAYGNYRLGRRLSDTDGPYTIPASSQELSAEYGAAADDRRHQFVAGATVRSLGMLIEPSVAVASGRPFNITTGRDDNGDTFFTDRPSPAVAGDAGAIATPFGLFNLNPQPGDPMVARNLGRESWDVNVRLAVSKTLPKGVMVTAYADNLLNTPRLVRYNGVLTSPVFGMPNQALNARRIELTVGVGF
jgi:hypothetical protein